MFHLQFDIRSINQLKNLLLQIQQGEQEKALQDEFKQLFDHVGSEELLLILIELLNGDYGVTVDDVEKVASMQPYLYNKNLKLPPEHPIQIFKGEMDAFRYVLNQVDIILEILEKREHEARVEELKDLTLRLGAFHNHFNRKEKLFFPILERYGNYSPTTRVVWMKDDRIRAFYKALKSQVVALPNASYELIRKTFDKFQQEMKEMMYQEEALILPLIEGKFTEEDWNAVANESDAFGYALIEAPKEKWNRTSIEAEEKGEKADYLVYGGGGYLTTEEAEAILNNLPLEITFVDKTAIFRYFNETTKDASEMMLIRTPSSIGRNVANCHPPKSLRKVMTVIRDLKMGRRTSESMWFKKKDQYIHITYKAVYNDEGEFLGILEYVQDIQPFFELPTEVKMGLTRIEE